MRLAALQRHACWAGFAGSSAQRRAGVTSVGVVSGNKGRGAGSVYAHARALQAKGIGHSATLVRRPIACTAMLLSVMHGQVNTWACIWQHVSALSRLCIQLAAVTELRVCVPWPAASSH